MAISTNNVGLSDVFAAVMEKGIHAASKREMEMLANELSALINKMVEIQKRDPLAFPVKQRICGTIKFKKEECAEMEQSFKKEFEHNYRVARLVKEYNDDGTYVYTIRYNSNSYKVVVSSSDLIDAKQKFIQETKLENIKIGA